MKVTVVTVAYNSAATIADTLRSVAMQRHPDIEHIVIDGVSKDGTLDIVRREGAHVARVVSEPDQGIYDAMNKGLQLATGELVGFLNADDLYADEHAVARIAEAAAAGADAVYGDLVYVREGDTAQVVRWWKSGAFEPRQLRLGWMPPHPTFYIRRAAVSGGFDTQFRIAADYEFMLRHLTRPGVRVAYVPEVLVRMRMGGASNRSLKALWDKMGEDTRAMRRHGVGGWMTLVSKNLRKLPQFVLRPKG